ncbi:uncharacterized protein METZ01_LOCUS219398, partial [marine metagenome]
MFLKKPLFVGCCGKLPLFAVKWPIFGS